MPRGNSGDDMNELFNGVYKGQRVLVTGHTGFKGSWLSFWLTSLGAEVIGVSLDPPTSPSNFEVLGLKDRIKHLRCDTRNLDELKKIFDENKPAIVFHLAAQAIDVRHQRGRDDQHSRVHPQHLVCQSGSDDYQRQVLSEFGMDVGLS